MILQTAQLFSCTLKVLNQKLSFNILRSNVLARLHCFFNMPVVIILPEKENVRDKSETNLCT